jgi:hypothetical protein
MKENIGFPLSMQANARIVPLVDHSYILSDPFEFSIHHSYHLTLCGVDKINHKILHLVLISSLLNVRK